MRLLLDTQILIWWFLDDWCLRDDARALMGSETCVVSVASVWKVAIKHRLGKLPLDPLCFRDQILSAGATLLQISDSHVIETGRLPGFHEDPFDRLLIAQARLEGLMAVSSDATGRATAWPCIGPDSRPWLLSRTHGRGRSALRDRRLR